MSWMEMLYRTYENCQGEVGRIYPAPLDRKGKPLRAPRPLLPVGHTLQDAEIEVALGLDGTFIPHAARVLDKSEVVTVIPCTEKSATRSGKMPVPHVLFDKLQYLSGDYRDFGGSKYWGYEAYIKQLAGWCASPFAHPSVCAVLRYLQKGCLIADLIADGILISGEDGRVLSKWTGEKEETPAIFKVCADPINAFVRFCVRDPQNPEAALFRDQTVRDSYIAYAGSLEGETDLCYVRGTWMPRSQSSPRFIRNSGDWTKLISANDDRGFTYRGRFETPEQAYSVGFETTNKAHSALKWLIDRQGWTNGDQVVVCWGTRNEDMPSLAGGSLDFFGCPADMAADTESAYAVQLKAALSGYRSKGLDRNADVVVMVLDAATPGRLSIPYYRELGGPDFLDRLQYWYATCTGWLSKRIEPEGGKPRRVRYFGTPRFDDIVYAAYGRGVGDKLKKATVERLLPCLLDKARIPPDLRRAAVARASNPQAMEPWEYEQTLDVACALIRKARTDDERRRHPGDRQQEVGRLANDDYKQGRSYVFGQILAYYDSLEGWATGNSRMTNAKRIMAHYRQMPARSAEILERQLQPYLKKLGKKASGWLKELDELYAVLDGPDENGAVKYSNAPLDETYLLGYRSQLHALWEKDSDRETTEKGE